MEGEKKWNMWKKNVKSKKYCEMILFFPLMFGDKIKTSTWIELMTVWSFCQRVKVTAKWSATWNETSKMKEKNVIENVVFSAVIVISVNRLSPVVYTT